MAIQGTNVEDSNRQTHRTNLNAKSRGCQSVPLTYEYICVMNTCLGVIIFFKYFNVIPLFSDIPNTTA